MKRMLASLALAGLGTGALAAQQPAAQQPATPPVVGTPRAVGTDAPDFTLPSATKDGVAGPLTLSGLRDQTVVIAFFFRARTRG
jgi:hypothetical protein